ncbi:histidine phosphatase family protein [Paenibacillus sp. MMS20-IR301]|uniref:histidine phosphatase family protein n=1 Tax=Paenibacillus sp. MMS20-IR301 TaxID=2895946 RepID=UPI0028ECCC6B|nr:histidine phosphatase family protein [Paenibacillus sp. MMS20-IR301]WNS41126.1 histidine phosphatase family protein [Paenibacillus sp. MMS20-IR301]
MTTYIYMVRHGDSLRTGVDEWTRGLSAKGEQDAHDVTARLRNEGIDALYCSTYTRAIDTIADLAEELGEDIRLNEDLREKVWMEGNAQLADEDLDAELHKMFADPDYALPGGESNRECQARAVRVLKEILQRHEDERVVIGTHGLVMTLMMGYYAPEYNLDFLMQTRKPDIYVMAFQEGRLTGVERLAVKHEALS